MAEIAVLPARLNYEGTMRLIASLTQAIEVGVDLGPRIPHIRTIGRSLEDLLDILRHEVADIERSVTVDNPAVNYVKRQLSDFVLQVDRLCQLARQ